MRGVQLQFQRLAVAYLHLQTTSACTALLFLISSIFTGCKISLLDENVCSRGHWHPEDYINVKIQLCLILPFVFGGKKKAMFAELRLQMSQALILMHELGKHFNFACQLANWDSDNNYKIIEETSTRVFGTINKMHCSRKEWVFQVF